jgi:hypothetical protein
MVSQVDKDVNETITIGLHIKRGTHENGMSLKEYADAVMSGTHPVLGHDDFVYHFGAEDSDIETLVNWVDANQLTIDEATKSTANFKLSGTVGKFNQLFNIKLQDVTDDTRNYIKPDKDITIPTEITDIVDIVLGLDTSHDFIKSSVTATPILPEYDTGGPTTATPAQLATAYKVPPGNGYGMNIAIAAITPQGSVNMGWIQSDVDRTFSRVGLASPTIVTVSVNGTTASTNATEMNGIDAESILDIYCIGGICPKAKIIYYIVDQSSNPVQAVIDLFNAVLNDTTNNPSVFSVSYGIGISTDNFLDTILQSFVVKGITVFTAAGDTGTIYCGVYVGCVSPYQISVGGTIATLNTDNSIASEVYWRIGDGVLDHDTNSLAGGGGITAYYPPELGLNTGFGLVPTPSWQTGCYYTRISAESIQGYPVLDGPYPIGSSPNPPFQNGRGIPDISAMAVGYGVYIRNSGYRVQGTSASCPIVASIWARLGSLLGYSFPFNMSLLYSNQATWFNDITDGNSMFQNDQYGPKLKLATLWELMATSGWDPITGLGTPKADQWYEYYHKGSTFPKNNYGFRKASTATYPRISSVAGSQRS